MSGNVSEWCWDWTGTVNSNTPEAGASSGSGRVERGGSWNNNANNRNNNLGFRVVRSAQLILYFCIRAEPYRINNVLSRQVKKSQNGE